MWVWVWVCVRARAHTRARVQGRGREGEREGEVVLVIITSNLPLKTGTDALSCAGVSLGYFAERCRSHRGPTTLSIQERISVEELWGEPKDTRSPRAGKGADGHRLQTASCHFISHLTPAHLQGRQLVLYKRKLRGVGGRKDRPCAVLARCAVAGLRSGRQPFKCRPRGAGVNVDALGTSVSKGLFQLQETIPTPNTFQG